MCAAYCISFGGWYGGDVLTTKDGQVIEGKVSKIKDSKVVFFTNEHKYVVTAGNVSSIQFEDSKGKACKHYEDLDSEFRLQMASDDSQRETWMSDLPLIAKIGIYTAAAITGFYIGWYIL